MTETLPATSAGIARAADLLRAGELVAFGTETVYGLGGDATQPDAVAAIFAAKSRPRFNPLICHYPDSESVWRDAEPGAWGRALAGFWPGPLTLVLPRRGGSAVAGLVSAGLETIAVRVPAPAPARDLLARLGRPVAAPSANRSGRISPTCAAHVLAELDGRIAAVLDGGACPVGVESTVIDLTGAAPVLLRPGGLAVEAIEAVTGPLAGPEVGGALRSPGLLASHYAPDLPLRLHAEHVAPDEALLAFGPALPGAAITYDLSPGGDVAQAASRLFEGLRALDAAGRGRGLRGIAAMTVPDHGLGLAINDRLRRAAAPRTP